MLPSLPRLMSKAALGLIAPQKCPGCDLPMPASESSLVAFCPACAPLLEKTRMALGPPFMAASPFRYQGPLQEAIRRFKYAGRSEFGAPLGRLLSVAAARSNVHFDRVVPVPLHPWDHFRRGFNQSALLAHSVSAAMRVPLALSTLRKTRLTKRQSSLDRTHRARNLRGAFDAKTVSGVVLLVDDVRTTGATGRAAIKALKKAGARRVQLLTLAQS